MLFNVIRLNQNVPSTSVNTAFLIEDRWDDWGKYRTQFRLRVSDAHGKIHDIGHVKIGHLGLLPGNEIAPNTRAPAILDKFPELPPNYFSLGQGETYYEALNLLPADICTAILQKLRDVAYDLKIFDSVKNEDVVHESLLRDNTSANVVNRLHRLAHGDATLTAFQFSYTFPPPKHGGMPPAQMSFVVSPHSVPPTNVHVLIGRNGVGKTHCMQKMAKALLNIHDANDPSGEMRPFGNNQLEWSFAGLVSVSFSAFDDFDLPESTHQGIAVNSVGLRYKDPISNEVRVKTPFELANDFVSAFGICRIGPRADRWRQAVQTLANDPVFADANAISLLELEEATWKAQTQEFFHKRLSSGHKIVLLTITRLVELVDERTLVLLDEPEGHLHPPLLSAFIRSLADLLVRRNGVAIIATHSPVVLQEVPQSCVFLLRRIGHTAITEKPNIETFGENVGVLTREVFGLEVTSAGFHQLIRDVVATKSLSYEQVLDHFGGQLGAEGRAIARGLITNRMAKAP